MEEQPLEPQQPQGQHGNDSPPGPPDAGRGEAGGRAVRRVGMVLLFALFFVSLAAGVFLVRYGRQRDGADRSLSLLSKAGKQAIGWISIRGPIMDSSDSRPWAVSSIEGWSKRLRDFGEDDSVKAIVLEINSPGGSVGAVQELHGQIQKVRAESKKPIIALMGDVAASGGYYLAAACDKVVAHPGTITGSIGVIFHMSNFEGLMKKVGVTADPIKSGKHKDIGSPSRPMTAEEKQILQALIDDAYGQFLKAVSDGRGIPEDRLRPLADGRIFTGAQALSAGLVDQVGTSLDAIALAKKLGHISGEPKILRRQDDVFDRLFLMLDQSMEPAEMRLRNLFTGLGAEAGLQYRWTGY